MSSSSSSVDAALGVINAVSAVAATSSADIDRILGGYAGRIVEVNNNLSDLDSQITQARSDISGGRSNPNDNPALEYEKQFVQKKVSALDLQYSDEMNAKLSDARILDRFQELDNLFSARVSTGVAATVEAKSQAEQDAINEKVKDLRIEDEEGAGAALARLKELIKSEGQRAIEAVGNLEQKKVDALLGDPKVDVTKLDRYKKKASKEEEEAAKAEAQLPPVSTGSAGQTEALQQDKALEKPGRNKTIDSVG
jgi:hypothetical protein